VSVGANPSSFPTFPDALWPSFLQYLILAVAAGISSIDLKHSLVLPVTDGDAAAVMGRDCLLSVAMRGGQHCGGSA
jgi:hypothetical protein